MDNVTYISGNPAKHGQSVDLYSESRMIRLKQADAMFRAAHALLKLKERHEREGPESVTSSDLDDILLYLWNNALA